MTTAQSKPLELVIHIRDEEPDWPESLWLYMPAQATMEDAESLAFQKGLTDSELTAEYWKMAEQCRYEQWIESVRAFDNDELTEWEKAVSANKYAALDTLYRFATSPHYWEVDA